jgi:hypothetical protein
MHQHWLESSEENRSLKVKSVSEIKENGIITCIWIIQTTQMHSLEFSTIHEPWCSFIVNINPLLESWPHYRYCTGYCQKLFCLIFQCTRYYFEKYFRWSYAQRQDELLWRNLKKLRTEVLCNETLCWWVSTAWYFERTIIIRNIKNCICSDIASLNVQQHCCEKFKPQTDETSLCF